ncbi:MAG: DUF4364 family protein [Firmicutes bacterium]|nr:DUF4364 family protein [Bacillota bacterium]
MIEKIDFVADEMAKKLILLFIFEKMEFPLTDASINEIIMNNPEWLAYMDFREALFGLIETNLIYQKVHSGETSFTLSQDGKTALSHFYQKIPASIREEIVEFAKENKPKFKKRQEYTWDYFKNSDGTYTVVLRILDNIFGENLLEIKLKTDTRQGAKLAANKWRENAASTYESLYMMTCAENAKEEKK